MEKLPGLLPCHAASRVGGGAAGAFTLIPLTEGPTACPTPLHHQKFQVLSPRFILTPALGLELVLSPLCGVGGPGHTGWGGVRFLNLWAGTV